MKIIEHWFWLLTTLSCVIWYSTITIYVAVRGAWDIKNILGRLHSRDEAAGDSEARTNDYAPHA